MSHRKPDLAAIKSVLSTILFYGVAVTVALIVALKSYDKGDDGPTSVANGVMASAAGLVIIWFTYWIIWLIVMRLTRGAPFRVGDQIEITDGEHRGATGKVSGVIEGRYAVVVLLEGRTDTEDNPVFYWNELRKVPVR